MERVGFLSAPPDGENGMALPDRVIAIVDDHPLIAKALRELIAARGHRTLEFTRFTDFLQWLDQEEALDLCIIDYTLPDILGDAIVQRVKERRPEVSVAIWSGLEDESLPDRVLDQGGVGFISKALAITAIPPAVDLMLAGEIFVSSRGRSTHYPGSQTFARTGDARDRPAVENLALTRREKDVMQHLLQGCSNKEIAARLELNPVTVKLHCRSIFKKLKVRNRTEATVRYLELTERIPVSSTG